MIKANDKYYEGLSSKRLRFRKLEMTDLKYWDSFLNDPSSTRHFPDAMKKGKGRGEKWIKKQLLRYKDNQFGLLAAEEKNTGKFIGQVGLITQEVEGMPELEIGYHLLSEYRRMGYATESAVFFRDYALRNTNATSIISIIHPDNETSKRVARKNGMTLERYCIFNKLEAEIFRVKL